MEIIRKRIGQILLFSILAIVLSSCAEAGPHIVDGVNVPYGFWSGFLHGFIAPFTSFLNMLDSNIVVYSNNNTGCGYTIGFVFGVFKPIEWLLYLVLK